MSTPHDVCVVGGAGHIGAPMAIVTASRGLRTLVYDLNEAAMAELAAGRLPFVEEGGEPLLRAALAAGTLEFTTAPAHIAGVRWVVISVGTPVDEYRNPLLPVVSRCLDALLPHLSDAQTLVIRSTVFPGVTEWVERYLAARGRRPGIAFCPERVVQGRGIVEMQELPQIVSATTPAAAAAAAALFERFAARIIRLTPREAEFAKLLCNAWRYIQFAATNQFYMLAANAGIDYPAILAAIKDGYPRLEGIPAHGFAAGPCLYKDTLQLAANARPAEFVLGEAAIQMNEGLPAFIVGRLRAEHDLAAMTVGLLGMAFKPDSDDRRDSLSYKLKKLLRFHAREVLTTDPLVRDDPELLPLDEVLARSDLLIRCLPHSAYEGLDPGGKPLVDVWG